MASLLDWFGKRVKGAFAEINPFDGGENYQSVVHGAPKAPQQPQQPSQQAPQQPRLNIGIDAFDAPVTQPQKPKIDINANAQLSQQKTKANVPMVADPNDFEQRKRDALNQIAKTGRPALNQPQLSENEVRTALTQKVQDRAGGNPYDRAVKDVGAFTAGSAEQFLGAIPRGIANAVNFVGSGFNANEAERRTNEFLRTTGQINEQGNAPLSQGYDRNSNAFKAGEAVGTGQRIATDIVTTALPGAAAEKALRGLNITQKGLQSANKGARIAGTVAPIVGGGLVSSAASQIKDPTQNAGQNFGTGVAFDIASAGLGPLASSLSRWARTIPMASNETVAPLVRTDPGRNPGQAPVINEMKNTIPRPATPSDIDNGKIFYHGTNNANLKSLADLQPGGDVKSSSLNRIYITENPNIAQNFGQNLLSGRLYGKHLDAASIGERTSDDPFVDRTVANPFSDYRTSPLLSERDKRVFENRFIKEIPNNTIIEDTPNIHKYLASKGYTTITIPRVQSDVSGPRTETIIIDRRAFKNPAIPATHGTLPAQIPPAASTPRPSAEFPVQKSPQIELPQQSQRQSAPTSLDISATNIPARPQLDRKIQVDPETPSNQKNSSIGSIPQLPTVNTKPVKKLDKAFRSTRSIIERQGESGRALAGGLQAARDTQELYLGELQKAMPTVTKLARKGRNALVNKDFENFVDATQGLAKPKNSQVAQAVQEWKAAHPGIRDRAVRAGLDVGDLGPDYYPHFIDYDQVFKDRNTYNQAINHLVKTGQAPNQEEAIKLLGYAKDISRNREFGNLEASRLIDLPFYDKTPNSFISYLSGSARRIAQTETFGQKDERALKLIAKIAQEGGDAEAAKNAYDIAVGAKNYNPTSESISRGIRKYITTTRLGLGALTNTSQSVNTGIVTGHLRTMGSMLKQLNPKTREFVADTGVISDALLNDLRTQKGVESFTSKVLGKLVNKVTAPGFGAVEKFNRSVAATAGRDYALRLAQKGDVATLRKLGVTGDISNKTLTEAQQIQAARKIVEKTQFKVDPQDLPGWVDSPGGKLVAQFRTFSYNQGKFFSNEVLKPAARGNLLPLSRVLAALPLGYALYETRRLIDGRPQEEDPVKVGLQSFSKIGGAGLVLDIYQSLNPVGSSYLSPDRRVSMAAGALGGPAVGFGTQAAGAISEAIQQKNVPEDESRLDGKVAVKSADGEKYTDLTPLTRFGIQQLPIVGTPTANRVLPYKKEAEADAGTPTIDAIDKVNKASKEKLKELEKSVGSEAYQISNLSQNEKEQLINDGVLTQDAIDEAESLVKDKRIELGLDKPKKEKTYADEYKELQEEFTKKSKDWSPVEKAKKQKELNYLAVQKDFDNDTVDLYGMSKGDVYNLVSTDQNGNKMVEDILKYGDALVAAGLIKSNKFRDKYGNVKLESSSGSGSKKKGGSKKKSSGLNLASIRAEAFSSKVPTFKAPPKGSASVVASPTFKKTTIKGYTPRIPKSPKTNVKKA